MFIKMSNKCSAFPFCSMCPTRIDDPSLRNLYQHVTSDHIHLVFQCLHGKCNNGQSWKHEKPFLEAMEVRDMNVGNKATKVCNFFTFEEMIRHFKSVHGITASPVQFLWKDGAFNKLCSLPKDLRTAKCEKCTIKILCTGMFQIKKHIRLEHEGRSDYTLGCRVCRRFRTKSVATWNDHFIGQDYSICRGWDFNAKLEKYQNMCLKGRSPIVFSCITCNIHVKRKVDYLEHVYGEKHRNNTLYSNQFSKIGQMRQSVKVKHDQSIVGVKFVHVCAYFRTESS